MAVSFLPVGTQMLALYLIFWSGSPQSLTSEQNYPTEREVWTERIVVRAISHTTGFKAIEPIARRQAYWQCSWGANLVATLCKNEVLFILQVQFVYWVKNLCKVIQAAFHICSLTFMYTTSYGWKISDKKDTCDPNRDIFGHCFISNTACFYLCNIYIVLGSRSNLGMLCDIWGHAHRLYAVPHFHYMWDTWVSYWFYIHGDLGKDPPQMLWSSHASYKELCAEAKLEGGLLSSQNSLKTSVIPLPRLCKLHKANGPSS